MKKYIDHRMGPIQNSALTEGASPVFPWRIGVRPNLQTIFWGSDEWMKSGFFSPQVWVMGMSAPIW